MKVAELAKEVGSQYLIRQVGGAPSKRSHCRAWIQASQYLIRQVGGGARSNISPAKQDRVSIPYSSGRGGARPRAYSEVGFP